MTSSSREEQPRRAPRGATSASASCLTSRGPASAPTKVREVTVQPSGKVSVATRHWHPGPGPLHHLRPDGGRAARRATCANVRVVTGDTDEFYWGAGTFASRGAVVAGSAVHAAARRRAPEGPAPPREHSKWPKGTW